MDKIIHIGRLGFVTKEGRYRAIVVGGGNYGPWVWTRLFWRFCWGKNHDAKKTAAEEFLAAYEDAQLRVLDAAFTKAFLTSEGASSASDEGDQR